MARVVGKERVVYSDNITKRANFTSQVMPKPQQAPLLALWLDFPMECQINHTFLTIIKRNEI